MSTLLVDGIAYPSPWHDTAEGAPLPRAPRGARRPTQLVVHESVTSSRESTENVLRNRGLGVHLMIEPSPGGRGARVTQHGDLVAHRMSHAASQNGTSIALEVITPYYPERRRPNLPWELVIESAGWADDGRDEKKNYLVPTLPQLEATATLIRWATAPGGPVRVPRVWTGLDVKTGRFALNRVVDVDVRSPGIWAHTYTAHADGGFPVLYAWLRLEVELSPAAAYAEAVRLATTPKRWANVGAWVGEVATSSPV